MSPSATNTGTFTKPFSGVTDRVVLSSPVAAFNAELPEMVTSIASARGEAFTSLYWSANAAAVAVPPTGMFNVCTTEDFPSMLFANFLFTSSAEYTVSTMLCTLPAWETPPVTSESAETVMVVLSGPTTSFAVVPLVDVPGVTTGCCATCTPVASIWYVTALPMRFASLTASATVFVALIVVSALLLVLNANVILMPFVSAGFAMTAILNTVSLG